MATKYGLAVSAPFVKGTSGSLETMRRNYTKDKLLDIACSMGWLVRETLGIDTFKACLNLVESSPGCGGGLERLAKAYKLDRLGPYRGGAINAANISSEEYKAHMARFGLDSYGEPLDGEEEAAAAAAALAASSQQQQQLLTQQQQQQQQQQGDPGLSLFDPDGTPALPPGQPQGGAQSDGVEGSGGGGCSGGGNGDGGTLDKTAVDDKKRLCKHVWRGEVCRDWTCDRAHPARCGNPLCYPKRRSDCQYWHRRSNLQPSQSSQSSQSSQPSQPSRQRHSQQQGNGRGAGPGRAGWQQSQGGQRQQLQPQRRQRQQRQPQQQGGIRQRQWPRCSWQPQPAPLSPPLPPLPPQHPGWQQQQQQQHWQVGLKTYRDVVKGAATGQLSVQDLLLERLAVLEARMAVMAGPYRS